MEKLTQEYFQQKISWKHENKNIFINTVKLLKQFQFCA